MYLALARSCAGKGTPPLPPQRTSGTVQCRVVFSTWTRVLAKHTQIKAKSINLSERDYELKLIETKRKM